MQVYFIHREWLCRDLLTPVAESLAQRQPSKAAGRVEQSSSTPRGVTDVKGVRRASISSGGVIGRREGKDTSGGDGDAFPYEVIPLTEANVAVAWDELMAIFRQYAPQLASFPSRYEPELVDNSVIQLRVKTAIEVEQIQRLARKIEVYIRGKFAMEHLKFTVKLDPSAEWRGNAMPLSKEEYIQKLAKENPVMSELFAYLKVKY